MVVFAVNQRVSLSGGIALGLSLRDNAGINNTSVILNSSVSVGVSYRIDSKNTLNIHARFGAAGNDNISIGSNIISKF